MVEPDFIQNLPRSTWTVRWDFYQKTVSYLMRINYKRIFQYDIN